MKKCFFTGIILLLPFAISVFLFLWIVEFLTDPFLNLAKSSIELISYETANFLESHPTVAIFLSRVAIIVFLVLLTFTLGFLTRRFVFSYLFNKMQNFFLKVPFIGMIYKVCCDITKITFDVDSKFFKQTVLIPFPHKEGHAVGFIMEKAPQAFQHQVNTPLEVSVFVPTSPHPVSGFLLMTTQDLLKPIDMSTEDAFKYIISCGTLFEKRTPSE